MTDGDVELVIKCCEDFWSGSKLFLLNESLRRRIMDFYMHSKVTDMDVVAYSYGRLKSKDTAILSISELLDRSNKPHHIEFEPTNDIEEKLISSKAENEGFLKSISFKKQTFLSLVSFAHHPKSVYD
jgi:hypothetical protein